MIRPVCHRAGSIGLPMIAVLVTLISSGPASCAEQPNVVLLMADDLGWGDPGYNGNRIIRTPHLDQMSREGIRFDRFYAAAPVCSPTRGSCLTGRNPYRYGVYSANVGHLRAEEICLAEVLKERGYVTGHFGKWHLGTLSPHYSGKGPRRKPRENYCTPGMSGFDEWFSTEFAVATWDPYDPANSHLGKSRPYDTRALYWHNGRNVTQPLTGCDSKIIMDRALAFIRGACREKKPFLAVVWFHAPHAPVVGGPRFLALYEQYPEEHRHYYAVVTALDVQVGRLRQALHDWGIERNTLVWFCSDNGPEGNPGPKARFQGSAGPLRGRKRSLYEGGIRVPGLLVWPARITTPRTVSMPCVTSDIFPTVLDALGIGLPPGRPYDGVSLLPLIDGKVSRRDRPIGFQFTRQAALVSDRYKLVHNRSTKRLRSDNGTAPVAEYELYDIVADPAETRNLAAEYPAVVARMKATLGAWLASCRASDQGADYSSQCESAE